MNHRTVTTAGRGDLQHPPREVLEARIIAKWRQRAKDPMMLPRIQTLYASLVDAWEDRRLKRPAAPWRRPHEA